MKRRKKSLFQGVYTTEDRPREAAGIAYAAGSGGRTIDCYLPGPLWLLQPSGAAYEEACEGARLAGTAGTARHRRISGRDLSRVCCLPEILPPATRAAKRSRFDWIREAVGQARYAGLKARHVEALMEKKGGPEAAKPSQEGPGAAVFRFAAKRYGFCGPETRPRAGGLAQSEGRRASTPGTDEEIKHLPRKARDREQGGGLGARAPTRQPARLGRMRLR